MMRPVKDRTRDGATLVGAILVGVGVLFLVAAVFEFDFGRLGWPFFIILPGLALIVAAVLMGAAGSGWLLVPGAIIITTGLLLLYQNATDHWESWAYVWALVAPGSVGIALAIRGAMLQAHELTRAGVRTAGIGLLLFLVGAAFFEGLLHISGRDFGPAASYGLPTLLILIGLLMLLPRLPSRPGTGVKRDAQ
jgi:hypothetical protein